jgi:hypothetical protein
MSNVFFIDGFDYRDTVGAGGVWVPFGTTGPCTLAVARNGIGQGCTITGPNNNIYKAFPGTEYVAVGETLYLGFAFNLGTLDSSLRIRVQNTTTIQAKIVFNAAGQIVLQNGSGSNLKFYSFAQPLQPNTWYYLEWALKLHPSAGESSIWLDSQPLTADGELDTIVTGINTGTASSYNAIMLENANSPGVLIDDLYIGNSHAGNNTLPLGDSVVRTVYPDANGAVALVSSSGNDNYANVNGQPPGQPQATPYNSSGTNDESDEYSMTAIAIPVGGAIYAVQASPAVVLSASGTKGYKHIITGGADGARISGSTSILYGRELYEQCPVGPATWDETNFNATLFGIKIAT